MKLNKWGFLNVILILLLAVFLFFLVFNFSKKKDEFITVEVTGKDPFPSWLIDSIKVGSKEVTYSNKTIAEVLDVRSYDEGVNKVAFLKLKLNVTKDANKRSYHYKQQLLQIGSPIDFSLNNTKITAYVTSINETDLTEQEVYKKVRVKLFYRRPYYADNIKVGDKVIEQSSKKLQSEVLDKKVSLASVSVTTSFGEILAKNDSLFRDIELELRLRVSIRGGMGYFANYQPLKVGNQMWVPMGDYNLYDAEVISISDDN